MIVFLLFKVTRWIAASIKWSGQQVQRSLPSAWLKLLKLYSLQQSPNTFVEGFSFLQGKNIIDSAEYSPARITAGGGILLRFRKHTHLKCKCLIGDIALMNQTVILISTVKWWSLYCSAIRQNDREMMFWFSIGCDIKRILHMFRWPHRTFVNRF